MDDLEQELELLEEERPVENEIWAYFGEKLIVTLGLELEE